MKSTTAKYAANANTAAMTCLANDIGYDLVFSAQLATFGKKGDVLIVLSGSGNSPNVVQALKQAGELGMKSFALLGFNGGAIGADVYCDRTGIHARTAVVLGRCRLRSRRRAAHRRQISSSAAFVPF